MDVELVNTFGGKNKAEHKTGVIGGEGLGFERKKTQGIVISSGNNVGRPSDRLTYKKGRNKKPTKPGCC